AGLRLEGGDLAVEVAGGREVGGDPVEFHGQPSAVGGERPGGGLAVLGPAHPLDVDAPGADHLGGPARVDGVDVVLVHRVAVAGHGQWAASGPGAGSPCWGQRTRWTSMRQERITSAARPALMVSRTSSFSGARGPAAARVATMSSRPCPRGMRQWATSS